MFLRLAGPAIWPVAEAAAIGANGIGTDVSGFCAFANGTFSAEDFAGSFAGGAGEVHIFLHHASTTTVSTLIHSRRRFADLSPAR
jgi:hypothetical protein